MYGNLKIAVVLPCYQVEREVAQVIACIPEYVDLVIAVNDASRDRTLDVLQGIASPRLVVLNHERNQGVGGAMATGYALALERQMDIIVKLDGDGQMEPEWMIDLIEPLASGVCDYAKGNRFLHARELKTMPRSRLLGNIILTFLTKIASGYWHTFDPQNGYLAISRDFLVDVNLERLRSRRYFFENEMLIQINCMAARVLDCPMPAIYRQEISSLRISRILGSFPFLLLRGFCSRLYHRYVLLNFSIVIPLLLSGSLFFFWGFVFGAYTWIKSILSGHVATTGTVMLSVLPLIMGFQLILQAVMFDVLQTPRPDKRASRHRLPKD